MESLSSLVFQYLHAIWRRKWIVALAAWAVCIVGWTVVAMIPSRYESTARVYVDADQLLTPLLRGIAVDVDPGQQLDVLQHTLLSRPNMEQLMHMADLDRTVKTAADKDALIQKLIQQITIIPQTRNLFVISYQDTNPTTARNVVQSLLTIFAENTAGTQRAQMDNAQRFLNDQIALYEQQLRDAEKRNADFRGAHLQVLSGAASAGSIDSLRKQLEQTKNDLQDAIVRRDEVQKNIDGLTPVGGLDATAAATAIAGGPNAEQRLVALQQQLADRQGQIYHLNSHLAE
jgi:polysaccharide chain length determinant protein (PEP-CTERM system associated)